MSIVATNEVNVESFNRLLKYVSESRLREASAGRRGTLIATESDKGRVVNSAAFRRLQQKAQVFPLEPNAAVRTRLTHSIEVAQVGRHLAQKVIEKADGSSRSYQELAALVNVVEAACLLHDIGNPPFGHLGEAALSRWYSDSKFKVPDLNSFDGNPQGFRLISFLSGNDEHGLNLTCSLLLSTMKYPWTLSKKPLSERKFGMFVGDEQAYLKSCEHLDWVPGRKFPLVRLMEAADDIAYSMSDLEDGLEKRIVRVEDLMKEFGERQFPHGPVTAVVAFKTSVINRAVDVAASRFVESLDDILDGKDVDLLPSTSEVGELLKSVSAFAVREIYSHESAEQVELAGNAIISGLLSSFEPILALGEGDFAKLYNERGVARRFPFELRLKRRLPETYLAKYEYSSRGSEIDRRCHLLVDFISGMTDDFALDTYQLLRGIRIK